MKITDKAILLRKVNYGETSLVLTMFGLNHGLRSFIFKGAKKKKGTLLLPLALLEITYFERVENQLGLLTHADLLVHMNETLDDPRKSAVLFFLCDLLNTTVKEEQIAQKDLFMFLSAELLELNQAPFEANYTIYVMMALTRFLGFEPNYESNDPIYFDLHEGSFTRQMPKRAQIQLSALEVRWFASSFLKSKDQILAQPMSRVGRQRLIRILLDYYSFHIANFSIPKSLAVLEEVFD